VRAAILGIISDGPFFGVRSWTKEG
jgi:hypothetical protein